MKKMRHKRPYRPVAGELEIQMQAAWSKLFFYPGIHVLNLSMRDASASVRMLPVVSNRTHLKLA